MRISIISLGSMAVTCLLGQAFSAQAAIDLTPEINEYISDGTKFQQLIFHENDQRIEYELPHGWTFHRRDAALHLQPPDKKSAEAVIEAAALGGPQPLNENVRKELKDKFVAGLPVGSQSVKIEQQIESPLLLSGNPTFEIVVSYQWIGEKWCKSALFVNMGNSQLTFTCTARKDDFSQTHQQFRTSILSWQRVEPVKQATQSADPTAQVALTH